MKYTLRQTEDEATVIELHEKLFPGVDWEENTTALWLAEDELGESVGFCTARKLTYENGVFLSRAGVLPEARGAGLQRRMIHVRTRWARSIGAEFLCTYVVLDNFASLTNLIKSGYKLYTPANRWVGAGVLYLQKLL